MRKRIVIFTVLAMLVAASAFAASSDNGGASGNQNYNCCDVQQGNGHHN